MPSRKELANAIRFLSMDAVEKAKSGHPGMPMGMADIAEVLWNDFLHHNPKNPKWFNRDRFVLSNGHGSMLLYSLLHFTGYDLSLDDIKQFRQLHSKTPGHPECDRTPGVETTTGPLGQGLANAVGMAIAEKNLAAHFNREGFPIVDHWTYVFAGDGCLMEGISHEVCSLAGVLGLGKLICFYDDNGISIDGPVRGWYGDDTPKRFEAYGWHVIANVAGHDPAAIKQAIMAARQETSKPTLICCKTVIGYGAPNAAGSEHTHGAPLGADEIAATRLALGWTYPAFEIPKAIYEAWDAREKGDSLETEWQNLFSAYRKTYPELAAELIRRYQGDLPAHWQAKPKAFIKQTQEEGKNYASRKASQLCLNAYAPDLPELFGGSADLTESNCTMWSGSVSFLHSNPQGNYIHYGVREFGMSAIMTGMALHGGFIPYGGTFLTFSDYARNAVRMAAITKQRVIFVYTHDSIGLGEDGPTHQPVEHTSMLRLTPNLRVWRPCDMVETAVAWQAALEHRQGPSCLLLSRQTLPAQTRSPKAVEQVAKGAYVLVEPATRPEAILIATGSEVALAVNAALFLAKQDIAVRVVSMPCAEVFAEQDSAYQESVLPKSIRARVAVEAGATDYWYKYVGLDGKVIGLDRFGESAPGQAVFEFFGFTVEHVSKAVQDLVAAVKQSEPACDER